MTRIILLSYVLLQIFIFILTQDGKQSFTPVPFLIGTFIFLSFLSISVFGLLFLSKSDFKFYRYQRLLLNGIVWVFAMMLVSQIFFDDPWIFKEQSQWLGSSEFQTVINPRILEISLTLVFFEAYLLITYQSTQIKWFSLFLEILPLLIGLASLCWLYNQEQPVFSG